MAKFVFGVIVRVRFSREVGSELGVFLGFLLVRLGIAESMKMRPRSSIHPPPAYKMARRDLALQISAQQSILIRHELWRMATSMADRLPAGKSLSPTRACAESPIDREFRAESCQIAFVEMGEAASRIS